MRQTGLTFDSLKHRYYLEGVRIPNVTSIIPYISPAPKDILEQRRAIGVAVHKATALIDTKPGPVNVRVLTAPATIQEYLSSWEQFKEEYEWEVLHIELRVYHPKYRYAGTLDRVGEMNYKGRRIRTVLDIKTGAITPEVGVQLAAYLNAYCESPLEPSERVLKRCSVQLKKNGTYRLDFWEAKDDWNCFLALLQVHNWKLRVNGNEFWY